MPRRNNRVDRSEPLDLTPGEIVARRPITGPPGMTRVPAWREREREERERRERQTNARVNGGIDWSLCLVPGCGQELRVWGRALHMKPEWRNHRLALPLCLDHLVVAANQAAREKDDPLLIEAASQVIERREAKTETLREAAKKAWLTKQDGSIYYLRLNGLIKVGWTRDINDRIRAYGPNVEVLVIYAGTRADETLLHRQLKPARAVGHEWYEDGPILADFIAKAIEQYGPANMHDSWTRPKRIVAGKRVKRSA